MCSFGRKRLEWRQPERVPSVLDPEHAEQEAVHAQNHKSPDHHSDLLSSRVGHTWDLEREADGCKGQDAVYIVKLALLLSVEGEYNLHIAATICVSNPNWFWKPPAK